MFSSNNKNTAFTWDSWQNGVQGVCTTGGLRRGGEHVLPASVDEWEASVDRRDDHHVDEAAQDGHPSPAAVWNAVGAKLIKQRCVHQYILVNVSSIIGDKSINSILKWISYHLLTNRCNHRSGKAAVVTPLLPLEILKLPNQQSLLYLYVRRLLSWHILRFGGEYTLIRWRVKLFLIDTADCIKRMWIYITEHLCIC